MREPVAFRFPPGLNQALTARSRELGQTRTEYVIRALQAALAGACPAGTDCRALRGESCCASCWLGLDSVCESEAPCVILPVEATPRMQLEGARALDAWADDALAEAIDGTEMARRVWKAMTTAAPEPTEVRVKS
jgi:hypothetical protein